MSGSADADVDGDSIVYVASSLGEVVHLTTDCYGLASAKSRPRPVRRARFPDRPVCKHCDPSVGPVFPSKRRESVYSVTCRTCGDQLDEDGTCPFCAAMEEVLGV